jgi:hypothetical protein
LRLSNAARHRHASLAPQHEESIAMSALRQPTPPADSPSVAALPTTSREVLDAIRAAYTFVDDADERAAMSILATRPDVAAVLVEALPHVYAIFGEGNPVVLITIDEHSSEPIRLSALIETTHPLPEAQEKRNAFYQAWWNDASGPVLGDLSFGLTWPRSA